MIKKEKTKTIDILDGNKKPFSLNIVFKYYKNEKEDLGGFKDIIS